MGFSSQFSPIKMKRASDAAAAFPRVFTPPTASKCFQSPLNVVCPLHINKIPCALQNACPESWLLLGGIMFYLGVWLSVVKQHSFLLWNLSFPTRMHVWGESSPLRVTEQALPIVCFFSLKLYIWLFTPVSSK